ncbi:golgin candidate 5 [Prunus dulcis]|uniref:Golgin candidate 5 n=1 Tax=Prunus dulcis TaxID=3755 RepID=A0A4Y1QNB7_PRUDU|nr:golgin candidate 5 [Prunus dulcis]BBH05943.1 golgin candidate 5 [Prunus dulcis]
MIRKSNDAEVESLREEYHERVATLERKVYALTKERDTLRREQNKKGDAAALLKEKDEIINQVMAEGLWPSSTERKLLFDPVISFMGQTNEGSSVDSSQKAESSEHPPKVDKSSGESESPQKLSTVEAKEGVKTETLQHSSTEQMADKEETEVVKEETDDKHAATVEETETVVAEHEKSESESEK